MTSKNLGDILIEQGIIDQQALQTALALQNRRLGEILIEEKLADPVAIANALKFQAEQNLNQRGSRLIVDAKLLDELLLRVESIEVDLLETRLRMPAFPAFRAAIENLLLEPLENLSNKVALIAATTAEKLYKKIKFTSLTPNIVIDRCLLDDLANILLHLVRNAIDHGIESTEQVRVAIGKPVAGQIHLEMETTRGQLLLTLTDDGQGIDEDKVYELAKSKNLLSKSISELTSAELYKLLFTAGFSTAKKQTSVSGRGIGLDVVETTLIRIGGQIKIESKKSLGTTFKLVVPLRYARISLLPIRIASQWVVVDSTDVVDIHPKPDATTALRVHKYFEHTTTMMGASTAAEWGVKTKDGQVWIVDEVAAPEMALVRNSIAVSTQISGVIGSARLSNGTQVLLIDLDLIKKSSKI